MKNIYITEELAEFSHHHEVVFDAVLMLIAMAVMGASYHWYQDSLDLLHQPVLSYSLMVGYTITLTLFILRLLSGICLTRPDPEHFMLWLSWRASDLFFVVFFAYTLIGAALFAIYIIIGWLIQLATAVRRWRHSVS